MMNEQRTRALERSAGKIGSDNGYEYKLTGSFLGAMFYEPASDGFYQEFIPAERRSACGEPSSILFAEAPERA